MFSRVFATLGAKNTVNTDVFGGSEAQNHSIYDVFLPLVVKSTVFTVFFGQHLAKHRYLRRFHHVAKCGFLIRKEQKYCKLQCFESALRVRGRCGGGGVTKMTSNLLKNQVTGLAALPFTS